MVNTSVVQTQLLYMTAVYAAYTAQWSHWIVRVHRIQTKPTHAAKGDEPKLTAVRKTSIIRTVLKLTVAAS
jgi:hypothetical protein